MPPTMPGDDVGGMIELVNVPKIIGIIISHKLKLASLHELDTVYGLEDAWRFLEVITVHDYNQMVISKGQ